MSGPLGGSIAPDAAEVVEEILLFRVEVLCRRSIDPALAGRGPETARTPAAPLPSFEASIAPTGRFSPVTAVLSVSTVGNSVEKSFEAALILLWRSSKLGEGRNS